MTFFLDFVLSRPRFALFVIIAIAFAIGANATKFRLDASADALVLENDEALEFYSITRERYGSDDFLIVTYSPADDLFSDRVLNKLAALRDALTAIPDVSSVVSILDVPLTQSPPRTARQLSTEVITLGNPSTDRTLAKRELMTSPLYQNLIISPDAKTTAIQVNLRRNEDWLRLNEERNSLRKKRDSSGLSAQEQERLAHVTQEHKLLTATLQHQRGQTIAEVRQTLSPYHSSADIHLGGVPMIAADSIDFVRRDLVSFGVGVICFVIVLLFLIFHRARWVLLPLATCFITGAMTIGLLGAFDWPVTIVSSNFISLLLIITLSLSIHLIVRHRELHRLKPEASKVELLRETLQSKFAPCLYTAVTTIVAFGSLVFSGIRPVIDFGWMMSVGVVVAFVVVFLFFPAALILLPAHSPPHHSGDTTDRFTRWVAATVTKSPLIVLLVCGLAAVLGAVGSSLLTVENRFIDYYQEDTEIYRGMELIDRSLGGTTPLDVIIDPPNNETITDAAAESGDLDDGDLYGEDDPYGYDGYDGYGGYGQRGFASSSYWFNALRAGQVANLHDYLDGLPETGKVLSIATTLRLIDQIEPNASNDNAQLSIIYNTLPDTIKQVLFAPYISEDGNQIRFAIRVFESDPALRREKLLAQIREDLKSNFGLQDDQIHLTGMLVLYNNMLRSLFRSQILTLGVVFTAIFVMFGLVFRNVKMAVVAIIPNVFAALIVLGLMGWFRIPLDLMTITIAAICIGIAVDDTIHYVHRFTEEFQKDGDYWAAVKRSHATIGRAMYYTTLTIALGFSILILSNFVPTVYFGLLTGFAMIIALAADLTLLPVLIALTRPLGRSQTVKS